MRKNGSMVSKCAVSCVRGSVLMFGTWNKTGKARKPLLRGEAKAAGCSSQASGRPLFWPPEEGKKPLSCWPGTRIKYPLGQLLIVCRDGGADTPHVYDQNSMTIKPQVDTSSKSPGHGSMLISVLCVFEDFCAFAQLKELMDYPSTVTCVYTSAARCDGPAQSSSLAHSSFM